jgi:hypothetical protein
MTNHLTPSQLANESGLDRSDVIAKCLEMGVPIFEGKIDKTLFRASMRESGETSSRDVAAPSTAT